MALTDRQLLDALSRMPFIDSVELALILEEPHSTVHRHLTDLFADGIASRVSHRTSHLPSSQRYHLTAHGIGETAWTLGFDTPSDFVRAYPMSREWLMLFVRRMDAMVSVYRLPPCPRHRRAAVPRGVPPPGPVRRDHHPPRQPRLRRSTPGTGPAAAPLYDRLRAIAEYDYSHRPDTLLILVPSVWERRLTTRFCGAAETVGQLPFLAREGEFRPRVGGDLSQGVSCRIGCVSWRTTGSERLRGKSINGWTTGKRC